MLLLLAPLPLLFVPSSLYGQPAPIESATMALAGGVPAVAFPLTPAQGAAANPRPAAGIAAVPAATVPVSTISPVQSTITVNAAEQEERAGMPEPYHVTRDEVLSSAGTWGDFTRYLQLLPGVVWNTDLSNDVFVRGGNPSENLYVVDGIEVPNINQIAVEGTTGGFASMVDTSAIQSLNLKSGTYDARFGDRLSSLIDIQTRVGGSEVRREFDGGISGAGGLLQRPVGANASLLLSAHRSVLNLVTNDIGINGVPIYSNGLAQLDWSPNSRNNISALSLNGADSIDITPEPCDAGATLDVQTQYAGARSTDGLVWKHIHSSRAVSTVVGSYSFQGQSIGQQLQSTSNYGKPGCNSKPIEGSALYGENTRDGIFTLGYDAEVEWHHLLLNMGTRAQAFTMDYSVSQPQGQQSPFNPNPQWTDSDSFARRLTTGQTGSYAEVTAELGKRWTMIAGAREETFSLIAAHAFEPRASLAFRIAEHQNINATWARSAQIPAGINILSYPQNHLLRPLRADQYSVGGDLWRGDGISLQADVYEKRYTNEPESTEYPSLMLANMVDTLGQQFVWLPLRTGGWGHSGGVELMLRSHTWNRLQLLGSATYSRTRYAAADGVLRPGNFDFPLVGNGLATLRIWKKFEISIRDTYATGRPYTPFDTTLSKQQSRGIYDLSRINALRGPAYNRLDADINRDFHLGRGILNIHGGLENALDRANFLGYAWMDSCHLQPNQQVCGMNQTAVPGIPETMVTQMPLFPSGAVRYSF